jgi:hypothetical protein
MEISFLLYRKPSVYHQEEYIPSGLWAIADIVEITRWLVLLDLAYLLTSPYWSSSPW